MKESVGKNDQLKEAFSNGKAQIFKNTSGWKEMIFAHSITDVCTDVCTPEEWHEISVPLPPCTFYHFIEKQNKKFFCDLQQIFNISNARWSSSAILAPLAFMLMPTTGIKFRKVYLFIAYPSVDNWFSTILPRWWFWWTLNGCPKGLKSVA